MFDRHCEPNVSNAEKSRRVPYLKPKSRIGISWDRLMYNVRYISQHWKDRVTVKVTALVLVYTVGFVSHFIEGREFKFEFVNTYFNVIRKKDLNSFLQIYFFKRVLKIV